MNGKSILMVGPIEKIGGGVSNHTLVLVKEYRKKGVNVRELNISPNHNYGLYINSILKVYKRTFLLFFYLIFFRKKYDVIHIQSSGPIGGFLPAITSCFTRRLFNFKLVTTFHHGESERFIKKHRRLFEFVLSNTDLLIFVSEEQRKLIQKYFTKDYSKKLAVIPNGFDLGMSENILKNKVETKEDVINIINLSRLFPVKGQKYLIQALHFLLNNHEIKDFKCRIIGAGPLYDELYSLIGKYNLEQYISLEGWLPKNKVAEYLANADFFVLPSLNEASPLVLFEALGVGLPVVATKVGGIPDIINSDDYGLLVKPGDFVELAEAIKIASSKRWDKDKILAYSKNYTWENIAQITYNSYQI
jgi:teichuronic acid biosynthesis glycosyltransferase TuaC